MHFDVAFIDVEGDTSADGFEISQAIRKHRPGVKILLAASVRRAAAEAGDLCEHGPHLAKPYDHQPLERHIQRLLAR
jgi:two-component SAPR family response regulator